MLSELNQCSVCFRQEGKLWHSSNLMNHLNKLLHPLVLSVVGIDRSLIVIKVCRPQTGEFTWELTIKIVLDPIPFHCMDNFIENVFFHDPQTKGSEQHWGRYWKDFYFQVNYPFNIRKHHTLSWFKPAIWREAFLLVATPALLRATQAYTASWDWLFRPGTTLKKNKLPSGKTIGCDCASILSMSRGWPFLSHWIVGSGLPSALQDRVAGLPTRTTTSEGWWTIRGRALSETGLEPGEPKRKNQTTVTSTKQIHFLIPIRRGHSIICLGWLDDPTMSEGNTFLVQEGNGVRAGGCFSHYERNKALTNKVIDQQDIRHLCTKCRNGPLLLLSHLQCPTMSLCTLTPKHANHMSMRGCPWNQKKSIWFGLTTTPCCLSDLGAL